MAPESQLREQAFHAAHAERTQSTEITGEDGARESGDGARVGSGVGDAVGESYTTSAPVPTIPKTTTLERRVVGPNPEGAVHSTDVDETQVDASHCSESA